MSSFVNQNNYFTFTAPSAAPQNVRVTANTTVSLTFAWDPPPDDTQNGVIRRYDVTVTEVATSTLIGTYEVTEQELTVNSLQVYTNYHISVSAYTVGSGPAATADFYTAEDSKSYTMLIMLQCFEFPACSSISCPKESQYPNL